MVEHDPNVEPDLTNIVTSPSMGEDQTGIVATPKEFSDVLTLDLTDDEIKRALQLIIPIKVKSETKFRQKFAGALYGTVSFGVEEAMKLIDEMEDEIQTRAAEELNLMVDVDASPVFYGEPPIIDLMGALPGHYSEFYGLDHEKKEWEVKRAKERGEDFLGSTNLQ